MFYSFNLEDHVPAQYLLRSIDQCLDLSDLRAYPAASTREAMKNIECFRSQCKSFPQGIEIAANKYSPQWVVLRYLLQEAIGG